MLSIYNTILLFYHCIHVFCPVIRAAWDIVVTEIKTIYIYTYNKHFFAGYEEVSGASSKEL